MGRVSPWKVRIRKVIVLPLLAATIPEIPRVFQSCRSASSRLPISVADMMMMRRTFVLSGASVTRTRSPTDSSATLTVTAFFRVFSPGATLSATVSAVSFTPTTAALSGLISTTISGLKAVTVPIKDLLAGGCAAAGGSAEATRISAAATFLIFSSEQRFGTRCALSFVKVNSRLCDSGEI